MECNSGTENEELEDLSTEEAHRLLGLWFRPEEKFPLPEGNRFSYLCYSVSQPDDDSINLGIPCYIISFCTIGGRVLRLADETMEKLVPLGGMA